jgi:hypothetical protein
LEDNDFDELTRAASSPAWSGRKPGAESVSDLSLGCKAQVVGYNSETSAASAQELVAPAQSSGTWNLIKVAERSQRTHGCLGRHFLRKRFAFEERYLGTNAHSTVALSFALTALGRFSIDNLGLAAQALFSGA